VSPLPDDAPGQWQSRRRGRSAGDQARTSYYGVPAVRKPHWKWLIICYFFLGGIAGGSYAVASIADLVGGAAGRPITRAGRYISLAALLPCPLLLVLDLGRPERFHHMLRILKLRSPMSLGVWGLLKFSGYCALSAAIQMAQDGLLGRRTAPARLLRRLPSRPIGLLGTAWAFFLTGYTGVLLAATAVPLWAKSYLLLGPLFVASAISNATAAIALVLSLTRGTSPRALECLERLERVALVTELGLLLATQANLGQRLGRPLAAGHVGRVFRAGVLGLGIAAPLALQSWAAGRGPGPSRPITALASLLVLAGGFALRYVIVLAGRQSADDPQATFELAKAGQT
jgi:formate-dependent nitrite reductase membrane component NrfD